MLSQIASLDDILVSISKWLPDGDLGTKLSRLYDEAQLKFLRTIDPEIGGPGSFDRISEEARSLWANHLMSMKAFKPSSIQDFCVWDFTWGDWWCIPRDIAEKALILGYFPLPGTNNDPEM